ncbi:MAG: hypothetical protein J7496_04970 [Novosphingobium sp.]|nr:hypothetical protein [Novosphingobium sp.]
MNFPELYESIIAQIVRECPGPDKFAHVFVGLGIWLAAALALRKPFTSTIPPIVVALIEAINEIIDRIAKGSWEWPDTLGDAAATLFWPLLLFAALRLFPWLGAGRVTVSRAEEDEPAAGAGGAPRDGA